MVGGLRGPACGRSRGWGKGGASANRTCSHPQLKASARAARTLARRPQDEAIDMWKSVVNSINLGEKQRLDVVSWKQMFMQKVGGRVWPLVARAAQHFGNMQTHWLLTAVHQKHTRGLLKTTY